LYSGIRELLIFFTIMAERVNPKIEVGDVLDEETGEPTGERKTVGVGDMVRGFRRWKIIAPEITPRDNFEVTQNEINKQNALLASKRSGMDAIGTEAPEAELAIIEQEQSNLKLNPASVQQQISVLTIVAQLEQMRMQNEMLSQQVAQAVGPPGQAPGSVLNPEQAQAQALGAQQQAQPTGFEDQNQPITQQGSPPPPGAPAPGGQGPAQLQALSRQNGDALNQIAFRSGGGQ
jgi:hypothetical protein